MLTVSRLVRINQVVRCKMIRQTKFFVSSDVK